MAKPSVPYRILSDAIIGRPDLHPAAKMVLLALQQWGHRDGRCLASNDEIGKASGLSGSTVKRSLVELQSAGLVLVSGSTSNRSIALGWTTDPGLHPAQFGPSISGQDDPNSGHSDPSARVKMTRTRVKMTHDSGQDDPNSGQSDPRHYKDLNRNQENRNQAGPAAAGDRPRQAGPAPRPEATAKGPKVPPPRHDASPLLVEFARGESDAFQGGAIGLVRADEILAAIPDNRHAIRQAIRDVAERIRRGESVDRPWRLARSFALAYHEGRAELPPEPRSPVVVMQSLPESPEELAERERRSLERHAQLEAYYARKRAEAGLPQFPLASPGRIFGDLSGVGA